MLCTFTRWGQGQNAPVATSQWFCQEFFTEEQKDEGPHSIAHKYRLKAQGVLHATLH